MVEDVYMSFALNVQSMRVLLRCEVLYPT